MKRYTIGQTWISETEPELGICRIVNAEFKKLTVHFPFSEETRLYSLENAPLKRVIYQIGDTVSYKKNKTFKINKIREKNDICYYSDGINEYPETALSATVDLSDAFSRLKMLDFDSHEKFTLRRKTLELQLQTRQSSLRGLLGARIELIPHQLYVVDKIATSATQRVLLADEVGLGKTIETCLLIHRFLLTGEISRVLILVPDHLVHQWFIELYSRFNLVFDILDETRYDTFEQNSSLLICGIDFLTTNLDISLQVTNSKWDILVVDEVHHLEWNNEAVNCTAYNLVKVLTEKIEKVILLSGTPEQLGIEGHFARLKLLDSDRYYNLSDFIKEQKMYINAAKLADKLIADKPLSKAEQEQIFRLSPKTQNKKNVIKALLDHYGTGRAMYRNTRHVIKGFPKRIAKLEDINHTPKPSFLEYLRKEFDFENNTNNTEKLQYDYTADPRIKWLAKKLRQLKDEKILLICHSKEKVIAIQEALLKIENFKIALFHEDMTVINRDRGAAWFAQKNGARILLCSEIGSEGRNFQFAHHLILYDLPLNPELLEQRIGRLDRIGQKQNIFIHVPYIKNSPQELMARWYHEGLQMIEKHLSAGHEFIAPFAKKILTMALRSYKRSEVNELIKQTNKFRNKLLKQLETGRDHLLELNSFDQEKAEKIVNNIKLSDNNTSLEEYCLQALEQFRIDVEKMSQRSYLLSPVNALISLPWLKTEDIEVTCSRKKALEREDISFLTWDHPLVTGLMDAITSSQFGNCSFAVMESDTPCMFLEAIFIIECQAPKNLHMDHFMPPVPIRILLDHNKKDLSVEISEKKLRSKLSDGKRYILEDNQIILNQLLPELLDHAHCLATEKASTLIKNNILSINQEIDSEIARLLPLQKINPNIKPEDIKLLKIKKTNLINHAKQAKTRLDSLCLIIAKQ